MEDEIISLEDFITSILRLTETEGQFLYRGQDNANHELTSCAYRLLIQKQRQDTFAITHARLLKYHRDLLSTVALLKTRELKDLDDFEKLAQLQHNGAPTGLIDFTFNPLVALYFACVSGSEADGAVYYAKRTQFAVINENCSLDNVFCESNGPHIFFYYPSALNNRITAQQGCFLISNTGRIESQFSVGKFVASAKKKENIIKALHELGISDETLFRDFYGFCKWGSSQTLTSSLADILTLLQSALTYIYIRDLDSANEKIDTIFEVCDSLKNDPEISEALAELINCANKFKGDVLFIKKDYINALKYYKEALHNKKQDLTNDECGRCLDISETLIKLKRYDEAEDYLNLIPNDNSIKSLSTLRFDVKKT